MTPAQLSKSGSEHAHQKALFAYVAVAYLHGWAVADNWCETGVIEKPHCRDCDDTGIFYGNVGPCYCKQPAIPALEWFHAIPNGGARGDNKKSQMIRGGQLKAEGVKPGVLDVFLPYPVGKYHGLYIEMKKPSAEPKRKTSKGGVSDEQREFINYTIRVGYGAIVCYNWRSAANVLRQYIEFKEN